MKSVALRHRRGALSSAWGAREGLSSFRKPPTPPPRFGFLCALEISDLYSSVRWETHLNLICEIDPSAWYTSHEQRGEHAACSVPVPVRATRRVSAASLTPFTFEIARDHSRSKRSPQDLFRRWTQRRLVENRAATRAHPYREAPRHGFKNLSKAWPSFPLSNARLSYCRIGENGRVTRRPSFSLARACVVLVSIPNTLVTAWLDIRGMG